MKKAMKSKDRVKAIWLSKVLGHHKSERFMAIIKDVSRPIIQLTKVFISQEMALSEMRMVFIESQDELMMS